MSLRSLILFTAISLTIVPARADYAASDKGPLPMATLSGPWRFHVGDDPQWSSDAFDDSSWSLLNAGESACRESVSGESRGPVCGMGICYECRVTINDVPHQRACLRVVENEMRVDTGNVSAK